MDFKLVMERLLTAFEREGVNYALMGGFALGVLGVPRATADIDFLMLLDDMEKAHTIMTGLGYELRYKSENVSQYVSPQRLFGQIDCLHAFREISQSMLQRARTRTVFNGELTLRVLQAEDVIGLKMQAIANDPLREHRDMADIEALMKLYGTTLDWQLLQSYFELFGFGELLQTLRGRYGTAE